MQKKCIISIISMHSQARATPFFAWEQMRLFFVSLTVIIIAENVCFHSIEKHSLQIFSIKKKKKKESFSLINYVYRLEKQCFSETMLLTR